MTRKRHRYLIWRTYAYAVLDLGSIALAHRLTDNPFWLLSASYEDTRAEIAERLEEATFHQERTAQELSQAQQALVTPNARLRSELAWLPELTDKQISTVKNGLFTQEYNTFYNNILHLPELARANLIVHIFHEVKDIEAPLSKLSAAWASVEIDSLLDFINQKRSISGFPLVNKAQISAELDKQISAHASLAATAVWSKASPGAIANHFVEDELLGSHENKFLGLFVARYDQASEAQLARIEEALDSVIQQASSGGDSITENVEEIDRLLVSWDDINQPVQVYEQAQGHEEVRSKKVYNKLRSLCLDLVEKHGKVREARAISEALLRTFPELESVAESLKLDLQQLDEILIDQSFRNDAFDIFDIKNRILNKYSKFVSGIKSGVLSSDNRGVALELYNIFKRHNETLVDTTPLYIEMRDLAVSIINIHRDTRRAWMLLKSLLEHADDRLSQSIRERIEREYKRLRLDWGWQQLSINTQNPKLCQEFISDMHPLAKGEERRKLNSLKAALDKRVRDRSVRSKLVGGLVAVAILIWLIIVYSETQRADYGTNTSTQGAISSPPASGNDRVTTTSYTEERPPVGTGRDFNTMQVRYCVFQGRRLDYMRPYAQTNAQVDSFNRLISDWNSRCSNFRYRQGTLGRVEREADQRSSILREEAQRIANSWPR